ncbi:protein spire homolog 2-like [Trichomycterus rosablanca]|uniref:protein spire homolog 2-like n=1 Tax=Trichomycterus rosablanca TaxID=2290929 RepID=UPI002F356332
MKDGRAGECARMARCSDRGGVAVEGNRDRDQEEHREVLSVHEVLRSYEQPLNEEQAWAVCYQCCRGARHHPARYRADGPESILLHRDGTVTLRSRTHIRTHSGTLTCPDDGDAGALPAVQESQLVQTMGVAIYRALDWGLAESEERELSPQLERLIERMVAGEDGESGECGTAVKDEGYSGPEDEDEEEEEEDEEDEERSRRAVRTLHQVMALCARRLADPAVAAEHYQSVCRALFLETLELQTFLSRIRDAKEVRGGATTHSRDPTVQSSAVTHLCVSVCVCVCVCACVFIYWW